MLAKYRTMLQSSLVCYAHKMVHIEFSWHFVSFYGKFMKTPALESGKTSTPFELGPLLFKSKFCDPSPFVDFGKSVALPPL